MQEEPYIISKKRTVRKVYKGRIVAAVLIACFLVIGGAIWFSRGSGKLKLEARKFGFVTVGSYSSLAEASVRAGAVIKQGGAGYILGEDEYRVMAACYASEEDAEKVCSRLTENGESASVYVAERTRLDIERPEENADLAARALAYPDEAFDTLYEISLKTDTAEISEAAAKYALLKISVTVTSQKAECATIKGAAGEYTAGVLSKIEDALAALSESKESFSQAVKYTLCEIADIICFSDTKNLS